MEAFTLVDLAASHVVPDHRGSPKITSAKEPDLHTIHVSTELTAVRAHLDLETYTHVSN